MVRFCRNCGYKGNFQDGTPGCIFLKVKVEPEKDFCSWHNMSPDKCDRCGAIFLPGADKIVDETLLLCVNCYSMRG